WTARIASKVNASGKVLRMVGGSRRRGRGRIEDIRPTLSPRRPASRVESGRGPGPRPGRTAKEAGPSSASKGAGPEDHMRYLRQSDKIRKMAYGQKGAFWGPISPK